MTKAERRNGAIFAGLVGTVLLGTALTTGVMALHRNQSRHVYELMHEVERCDQAATKLHISHQACMYDRDELSHASERYL